MLQSKNSLGKQKNNQKMKRQRICKNTVWNRIRAIVCVNLVFQWINGLENGTNRVPKMNVPINRTNVWAEWRPIPFEIKSDINNDLDWHKLRYVVCANDRLFYSAWLFFVASSLWVLGTTHKAHNKWKNQIPTYIGSATMEHNVQ